MARSLDANVSVLPSAAPSEVELETWHALPRDEQMRRLRAALSTPDCSTPSSSTMDDILERARRHSPL